MSVLSRDSIKKFLNKKKLEDRLIITPLLDYKNTINASSIDVRLGNIFIIIKQQSFSVLDVSAGEELKKKIKKYQEKVIIDYKTEFVLHPNQLVIGSTFEYIGLPKNLMCYVIGKSSWGRMGLIIATATKVDPGFKGCISLEIVNEGQIPIILYPGIPIAQLVFHETSSKNTYDGIYKYPTGPQFPNFSTNYERWKFWFEEE